MVEDAESHLDLIQKVERLEESVNQFLFCDRLAFEDYVDNLARIIVEDRVTTRHLVVRVCADER